MLGGTTEKDGSHGTRKAAGLYRSFGRIALDDEAWRGGFGKPLAQYNKVGRSLS